MPGGPVTPETTLAIILGASEFPKKPKLASGAAFAASARGFQKYLLDEEGFSIPADNLLDVFDSKDPASRILESIEEFLAARQRKMVEQGQGARDLLLYYVGHGAQPDNQFALAVRDTKEGSESPTMIRMADLAKTVKDQAGDLRRFVILDCCFAGHAYRYLQSAPIEMIRAQTMDLPTRGTSLLASSSARETSTVKEEYTISAAPCCRSCARGCRG